MNQPSELTNPKARNIALKGVAITLHKSFTQQVAKAKGLTRNLQGLRHPSKQKILIPTELGRGSLIR